MIGRLVGREFERGPADSLARLKRQAESGKASGA
jgi:hypothetical protein